jgi:hypothetical protein
VADDTDAGDRPGTPERYDREGAWERLIAEIHRDATTAYADPRSMFFAELDAAVAWAIRRERERAAKMIDALASRCRSDGASDGYRELAKRIRSDPDAPAPTTKE